MLSAEELVRAIASAGGVLSLHGDKVKYLLPAAVAHLADELREHKPEIVELLRKAGDRIACFPMCPRCDSYWLHREGNVGPFECQRCNLGGIEEHTARMASFLADSRSPGRVM